MQKPFFGDIVTGAPGPPSAATAKSPNDASGKWKCPWAAWKMNASGTLRSPTLVHCDPDLSKNCWTPW